MSKDDARKHNLAQLHERRKEVVRLHLAGHPVMQIVQMTGLSWPAVRRAIDNYASGGEAAIAPATRGRRSGDGRSLSEQQERAIRELICTQRPQQLGFDQGLWSRVVVHDLIRRECEVDLSERAVGNYIHRWGFGGAVPMMQKSAVAGDSFRQWLVDSYPTLVRRAKAERAEIHWLEIDDLQGFEDADSDPAKSAEPQRKMLATVTNQRKTRWMVNSAAPDDTTWIEFFEALLGDCSGKLLLIVNQSITLGGADLQQWMQRNAERMEWVDASADEATASDQMFVAASEANAVAAEPIKAKAADVALPVPISSVPAELAPMSTRNEVEASTIQIEVAEVSAVAEVSKVVTPEPAIAADKVEPRVVGPHPTKSVKPFAGNAPSRLPARKRWIAVAAVIAVAAAAVGVMPWIGDSHEERVWSKPMQGDYWAHRVAYPAMHFSPSWYADAKPEDAKVRSDVPMGEQSYLRQAQSPLALNPGSWTFLGPQPLLNGSYGQVSGRVNVIVVDPTGPDENGNHTVLAASDGGGIWKSTNCCSAATTWRNTTDQPDIASIAIGDLYIDPNDANVIYAGTGDLRFGSFSFGSSGVLKSIDKGETWRVLGEGVFTPFYPPSASLGFPQYQAVGKVVTDPNNSNTVVVGTKTGVFVSNNGGTDWTGPCYTNTHIGQRQDITGLIAQDAGGGQTRLFAAVGTRGNATTVQPDLANLGANGVYRATLPAAGCPTTAAWTLLNSGWPAGTGNGDPAGKVIGRIELAIAPSNPSVMYAMAANAPGSTVEGVWRSNNGGDTWTQTAVGSAVQAQSCANATAGGGQMWYDAGLSVDPNNAETVLLSGVDLYRSTNGGSSFQNVSCGYGSGNVHVDHHARAYLPLPGGAGYDSNRVLLGSDGGVYHTNNVLNGSGGTSAANRPTFTALNATIGSIELYSGDITANFATAASPGASAGAQDNGSSSVRWSNSNPSPSQWTVRLGGDGIYTRIEPVNELRWYYSSQNGNLVASTTGPTGSASTTVTPQTTPAWGGDVLSFVMPVEIYRYGALDVAGSGCTTAVGCTYMLGGTNRVWETLLGGIPRTSWYINSPNLTKNTLGNRSFINQLAHAYSNPTVVIVGTNDGNVQVGHGMNQGVANTATWANVTGGNAVLPNRPVMDVAIDVGDALAPTVSSVGYAALGGFDQNTPATPGHIYQLRCENSCATYTWRNVSGNLPNIPANSVAVNPHIPNQVFAGTDWGLYYTNDITAASPIWFRFDNGLPRVMIWDMAIDRGASILAVFTRGRGAWAWPLPTSLSDVIYRNGFDSIP